MLQANGTYMGWKVHILVTKPGDIKAYVAVDDFRYIGHIYG